MADIADLAQQTEELNLTAALSAHARNGEAPELDDDGNRTCLDCGVVIPTQRVQAVNAVRCVDCQHVREHQQRGLA